MKVLYFSDNYTYENMGVKRSLFEEVCAQNISTIWIDKSKISSVVSLIGQHSPDQVWLAHSNLRLPLDVKKQISIPVVGFGFSDPYYFSRSRFLSYDIYVTNHKETFEMCQKQIPCIYNPTACDFRFHCCDKSKEKKFDASVLGLANHRRFKNKLMRVEVVNLLRSIFDKYRIEAFGRGWPAHPNNHQSVSGDEFLSVIQSSKVGLDIQEDFSPLSHKMFEYAACGVPVLTRNRPEVFDFFTDDEEILSYSSTVELISKLSYYLKHPELLVTMGKSAWERCRSEHNISFRVSHLISELKRIVDDLH